MKFAIKHEIKGRIRIHLAQKHMTYRQADILQCYLEKEANISKASVYVRTQDVAVVYTGSRDGLIRLLSRFSYETAQVSESALENSGRELNETYKEKLINSVVMRTLNKMFLPYPVRVAITTVKSVKYIYHGVRTLIKGKLEVPVLDAAAIGVSMLRGDFNTAGSPMFLLGVGEILEEWTHKKSVNDLARSMSIYAEKVWFVNEDGQEVLISASSVKAGDLIRVHMGNVIPFDGDVAAGEAMVNQTSLTGESAPVRKAEGSFAYAGTVLEEGELTVKVKEAAGSSRYEKIVNMIEDSEKLKSSVESNAEHLADRLVPYTLAGTGITYLLTRNMTKTLAVLMVDFSCALKLAMPVSVLSAIREASTHSITVKGGKYMEAMADATTIVFDKTGTLTEGKLEINEVQACDGYDKAEILKIACSIESKSKHPIAHTFVQYKKDHSLELEEVENFESIAGKGLKGDINGQTYFIGNKTLFSQDINLENNKMSTTVIIGTENEIYGLITLKDKIRDETPSTISSLNAKGIKTTMITGDNEATAKLVADEIGLSNYYADLLPQDKVNIVSNAVSKHHDVAMVGDGVNDTPSLARANVGIAMGLEGADVAIETADIVLLEDKLSKINLLVDLAKKTMGKIKFNVAFCLSVKVILMILGIAGYISLWEAVLIGDMGITLLVVGNSLLLAK